MSERRQLLVVSRCFNHAEREASARCTACGRFYCRECVAEHDGRMICGSCLRKEPPVAARDRRRWFSLASRGARVAIATVVAWLVFYTAGRALLQVPTAFHEGTIWTGDWWEGGGK